MFFWVYLVLNVYWFVDSLILYLMFDVEVLGGLVMKKKFNISNIIVDFFLLSLIVKFNNKLL